MGYRKAAMMRRRQCVSGHYRTSKTGKTYWVSGHVRNDSPPQTIGETGSWILLTGFISAPFTFGLGLILVPVGLLFLLMDYLDTLNRRPKL